MRTLIPLAIIIAMVPGCPQQKKAPPPVEDNDEATPPPISFNEAFIKRAFGPDFVAANQGTIQDIDPEPGLEGVIAIRNGSRHELAVVRGNHKSLARVPLTGGMLMGSTIKSLSQAIPSKLFKDKSAGFLLAVETLTRQQQRICGVLAFRYRAGGPLSLVGHFATRCGKKGGSLSHIQVSFQGERVVVIAQQAKGSYHYIWDDKLAAFTDMAAQ